MGVRVRVRACVYVCMHVGVRVRVCVHVCMRVRVCVCVHERVCLRHIPEVLVYFFSFTSF